MSTTTTSTDLPANTIAPAVQVIPPGNATPASSSRLNFPTAAVAVVALLAGLVGLFFAYRLYVFFYRRKMSQAMTPLPNTRPLTGPSPGPMSPTALGNTVSQSDFSHVVGRRSSNMALGSMADWDDEKYMTDFSSPGTNSGGSNTPIGQGASSFDGATNASRASLSGTTRHPMVLPSTTSRSSLTTTRRGMYGANALYNGPQLRSAPSSTRLSGAPHASHSRIDIVTPLPLAPPPGSVIATGKSAIDFAPSAGIGGGLEEMINLNLNANQSVSGRGTAELEYIPSWRDVQGLSSHGRETSGSGSGTRTPDSSLSSGRHSSAHSHHPTQHFPAGPNHSRNFNNTSTSEFPHRIVPSGSAEDLRGEYESQRRYASHKAGNTVAPYQALSAFSGPSSPLDKLQQRIAQEAHRDVKAQQQVDRVRRANDAHEGLKRAG